MFKKFYKAFVYNMTRCCPVIFIIIKCSMHILIRTAGRIFACSRHYKRKKYRQQKHWERWQGSSAKASHKQGRWHARSRKSMVIPRKNRVTERFRDSPRCVGVQPPHRCGGPPPLAMGGKVLPSFFLIFFLSSRLWSRTPAL